MKTFKSVTHRFNDYAWRHIRNQFPSSFRIQVSFQIGVQVRNQVENQVLNHVDGYIRSKIGEND